MMEAAFLSPSTSRPMLRESGAAISTPTPMSIPTLTPASLSDRLLAYARMRRTVLEWMHPTHRTASALLSSALSSSALPSLDSIAIDAAARHDPQHGVLAEAFLNATMLPAASLGHFFAPGANLVMLSIADALAVCRLRVLLDHAPLFRSWIDKPRRRLLTEWVGASMAQMLLTQPRRWQTLIEETHGGAKGETHDEAHEAHEAAASLKTLNLITEPLSETADVLAWCGFRVLERDSDWCSSSPAALLRLALPAAASLSSYSFPWTKSLQSMPAPSAHGTSEAAQLSAVLLSQLPDLFPEPSW